MDNIFRPFNKDGEIYKHYRNLPHWEQPGATYFTSFRLADSLPQHQLDYYASERAQWLKEHPKPWTQQEYEQYQRRFTARLEQWLDNGYGSCVLRQPSVSKEVAEALHYFDGERYVLDKYVIMPNHVHVLVKPHRDIRLKDILQSWRSYTASQINELLDRRGQLWMDEPFDHIVRTWGHLLRFRRYISNNPEKADLDEDEYVIGSGISLVVE